MAKKKPKESRAFIEGMERLGFAVTVAENRVDLRGNLSAALRFADARRELAGMCLEGNREKLPRHVADDDDTEFKGGTFRDLQADLSGHVDMKPFLSARAKLQKGALYRKLQHKIATAAPRRKRVMSEHDGDWDYGRRWEIAPFAATTRAFQPARVVKIRANFDANCSADAKSLDRYGTLVWALNDLIEQSGVRTEVIWAMDSYGIDNDMRLRSDCEITLKKAEQYVAPSLIAAASKARFFRRIGFGLIVSAAQAAGREVRSGLGRSESQATIRFDADDSVLRISPDCIHATDDEIEAQLLKAINR